MEELKMKHFEKYTETERKELIAAFAMMGMMGIPAPATVEDLHKWCDNYLANKRAEEEKTAKRKEAAAARNKVAGANTKKNWKRKGTEIAKLEKEIEAMKAKIAGLEADRAELANKYKEETGEEIE
jgi:predicted RNase H-like nuclease (RuvC/YqgF family)